MILCLNNRFLVRCETGHEENLKVGLGVERYTQIIEEDRDDHLFFGKKDIGAAEDRKQMKLASKGIPS
jgi:hypothetical protein